MNAIAVEYLFGNLEVCHLLSALRSLAFLGGSRSVHWYQKIEHNRSHLASVLSFIASFLLPRCPFSFCDRASLQSWRSHTSHQQCGLLLDSFMGHILQQLEHPWQPLRQFFSQARWSVEISKNLGDSFLLDHRDFGVSGSESSDSEHYSALNLQRLRMARRQI